jgi:hypothetical protein
MIQQLPIEAVPISQYLTDEEKANVQQTLR